VNARSGEDGVFRQPQHNAFENEEGVVFVPPDNLVRRDIASGDDAIVLEESQCRRDVPVRLNKRRADHSDSHLKGLLRNRFDDANKSDPVRTVPTDVSNLHLVVTENLVRPVFHFGPVFGKNSLLCKAVAGRSRLHHATRSKSPNI
jgi:hypothetical protein